jgi:hypothetical protein
MNLSDLLPCKIHELSMVEIELGEQHGRGRTDLGVSEHLVNEVVQRHGKDGCDDHVAVFEQKQQVKTRDLGNDRRGQGHAYRR